MGTATIDWGDASTDTSVTVADGDEWSFTGEQHAYAAAGSYTVTVTGPGGGTDTVLATVTAPPAFVLTALAPATLPDGTPMGSAVTLTGANWPTVAFMVNFNDAGGVGRVSLNVPAGTAADATRVGTSSAALDLAVQGQTLPWTSTTTEAREGATVRYSGATPALTVTAVAGDDPGDDDPDPCPEDE